MPNAPLLLVRIAAPWLATIALLGACDAGSAPPPAPTALKAKPAATTAEAGVAGTYAMAQPMVSELRVVALPGSPGSYRVEMHGGGDPRDGAGVGADCEALAEGQLQGDAITAPLLPFESDIGGLDASDLASKPTLTLTVDGKDVVITGEFAHCAMNTAMAGRYVRTAAPKLWAGCPPLPAACWKRD